MGERVAERFSHSLHGIQYPNKDENPTHKDLLLQTMQGGSETISANSQ
jgi:hypothetical protein